MIVRVCCGSLIVLLAGAAHADTPVDPFGEMVRNTGPRTPQEERASFQLPPGFEMQLFAAEPDIAKPINMAFDERGRMWVTETREYPFPAAKERVGRDAIKVLEDTDGDGRADKITTFADELNIPTGVLPYRGGAIAWSIPNIWHLQDTDGDGKADKRDVLYGPLGWEKDTHGMSSTFRRGFDGWMYLHHGYANTSVVRGRDGSQLELTSGNVYRVQLDGGRVEPYAFGLVNPFGGAFDPLGNLYSADCHTNPINQLLRGAFYPRNSRNEGLGLGPTLMEHSHGSTGIAGLVYYADDRWPEEFRDNIFVGNPVTSRINRDRLIFEGTSPRAIEQPDFVTTLDPWFRPVDLQLGPDGALYIADFYNRIIAHYEVPLDHPGRDRERGRIWRLVYTGKATHPKIDLSAASIPALTKEMSHANFTRRMLAMHQLGDRGGPQAVRAARTAAAGPSSLAAAHALWVLHRLGVLGPGTMARLGHHRERAVRVHVQRALAETATWTSEHRRLARAGLSDKDPHVRRVAAEALGQHPAFEDVRALLAALTTVPETDTHLRHVLRIAGRNTLASPGHLFRVDRAGFTEDERRMVADLALGIRSAEAGAYLVTYLQRNAKPVAGRAATDGGGIGTRQGAVFAASDLGRYAQHAARTAGGDHLPALAAFVRGRFADKLDLQTSVFQAIQEGSAQRGEELGGELRLWGTELATGALAGNREAEKQARRGWQMTPIEGMTSSGTPWRIENLASAEVNDKAPYLSSGSEKIGDVGAARSPTFALPPRLSFFLAGEDGKPNKPADGKVMLRVRAADTDEIIASFHVPGRALAERTTFIAAKPGTLGYLELIDGQDSQYGWIAVGGFDPPVVTLPTSSPREEARRLVAGATLVRTLSLATLIPRVRQLFGDGGLDLDTRAALGRTLWKVAADEKLAVLVPLVEDAFLPPALRTRIAAAAASDADWHAMLAQTTPTASTLVQVKIAQALAGSRVGVETLLALIEKGRAPARLLLDRGVSGRLDSATPALRAQAARLTEGLPALNEEIQRLIETRRAAFAPAKAQPTLGAQVFVKVCSPCHRIEAKGGAIGPELSGIGQRGLDRLLEDVLDPNRNVDQAFRAKYITLRNDEILFGLLRREEDQVLMLVDLTGVERVIPKKDIIDRRDSDTSMMPDNFGEMLSADELNNLMSYLLSKTAGK